MRVDDHALDDHHAAPGKLKTFQRGLASVAERANLPSR
jgi:hypothetical protein